MKAPRVLHASVEALKLYHMKLQGSKFRVVGLWNTTAYFVHYVFTVVTTIAYLPRKSGQVERLQLTVTTID